MRKLQLLMLVLTVSTAISRASNTVVVNGQVFYYNIVYNNDAFTGDVEITYGGDKYDNGTSEYTGTIEIPANFDFFENGNSYSYRVVGIGGGAFYNCALLDEVIIPEGLQYIGGSAFALCQNLESVSMTSSVVSIGAYAFDKCVSLHSIELCNGLEYIGHGAFSRSGICSIHIPKSLKGFGFLESQGLPGGWSEDNPFSYCESLKSITVDGENRYYNDGSAYGGANCVINTSGGGLLSGCSETVIPSTVSALGIGAFCGCSGLKSIALPNSIVSIGTGAFHDCQNLESIVIPSSVKYIDDTMSFSGCSSLVEVHSKIAVPFQINSSVFSDCVNAILYVPYGTKLLYESTEGWNQFSEIIEEFDGAEIAMSSVGYSTYANSEYNLDFTNVEGVKAYIASDYDLKNGILTITRVKNVPAGTGVLLVGTASETFSIPSTEDEHIQANLFVGVTDVDKVLEQTEGDYTNYYLSIVDGTVGFYKVAEGHTITIGVGKAYLPIKTSSSAAQSNGFIIEGVSDEVTKINQIVLKDGDGVDGYIDLNGVRTNKLQSDKIYINTNTGKKFIKNN